MSLQSFIDLDGGSFEKIAQSAITAYGGSNSEAREMHSYLSNMSNGKKHMRFFELLMFAQLIGLPTGLFLFFTQMVSDEGQLSLDAAQKANMHAILMEKVRRAKNSIVALEEHLATCDSTRQNCNFLIMADDKSSYLANVEILRSMVAAYGGNVGT